MTRLKIDKGVKAPPLGRKTAVWWQMKVNESVFMPGRCAGEIGGYLREPRKAGLRFTARSVEENGIVGCRVWRVE